MWMSLKYLSWNEKREYKYIWNMMEESEKVGLKLNIKNT